MFSKFELIGAAASVLAMTLALYLVQSDLANLGKAGSQPQQAAVSLGQKDRVVVAGNQESLKEAISQSVGEDGNLKRMIIDDIKFGTGEEVKAGDKVKVHYVGTLQNGQEFDNSRKRGEPFEFVVGKGMVIKGWDEGLVGMKVGGQRILVIPPEMAYGERGVGPIPPNATLVFAIELIEIE